MNGEKVRSIQSKLNVLLLLSILLTGMTQPLLAQKEKEESYFAQISHSPTNPKINDTVTFSVSLQQSENITVTNVTLTLISENASIFLMEKASGARYEYVKSFNSVGNFSYFVSLFSSNALVESSEMLFFEVLPRDVKPGKIQFENQLKSNLTAGNHTIESSVGGFRLELQLSFSSELMIKEQFSNESSTARGYRFLSNIFSITLKNSSALDWARLTLSYNQSTLIGANPQNYRFMYRENVTDQWRVMNGSIDPVNQTISSELPHFSDWVVSAQEPLLHFRDSPSIFGYTEEFVNISTVLTNYGSYSAANISVRIILPQSVIIEDNAVTHFFSRLDSLEELSITWIPFFMESGNYTIICIAEAPNAGGDVLEIFVSISDKTSTIDTSNSQSVYFIHYLDIIVMIITLRYILRKLR